MPATLLATAGGVASYAKSKAAASCAFLAPRYLWQCARGERLAPTVGPTVAGLLYVALGVSALGYACWTRGVAAVRPG